MGIEYFNNEERVLINSICKGENLPSLTREDVMQSLLFSRKVASDDMVSLVDDTYFKFANMSNIEWDDIKMLVPFPVAVAVEDEVSDVPSDEDSSNNGITKIG